MIRPEEIFLSGGSGRLGSELKKILPGILAPSSKEVDVTNFLQVKNFLSENSPKIILHAAAYTNVAKAETEREKCWSVNVGGTKNIVRAALEEKIPLVHISTDYVFWGDRGNYTEDDTLGPVRNYYSLTKIIAEQIVTILPEYLVIRTSFRPSKWEYPVAFDDVLTTQDYVDIIAPEIALAVQNFSSVEEKILHIATEKKSVYELAKRRNPEVAAASKKSVSVSLPDDISLNTDRWQKLKEKISAHNFILA